MYFLIFSARHIYRKWEDSAIVVVVMLVTMMVVVVGVGLGRIH